MLKSNIKRLIVVLILICNVNVILNAYEPPSDEELWDWWSSLTFEEKLNEIKKLDIIEHSEPEIIIPDLGATLLDSGDLIIFPIDPIMTIKVSYLEYEVELPSQKITKFYVQNNNEVLELILPIVFGIGIGIIGTAIADMSDNENTNIGSYFASGISGAVCGVILSLSL